MLSVVFDLVKKEIVKILATLTDNPNAPNRYGNTPSYWAAYNGQFGHR